jgi:hypothetical protein
VQELDGTVKTMVEAAASGCNSALPVKEIRVDCGGKKEELTAATESD